MTPRDRILAAMEFTGPDRAPIQHYCFPGALQQHGQKLLDLLACYPDDFDNEAPLANLSLAQQPGEAERFHDWQDGWGTTWRRSSLYTSGEVVTPALPTWDAWSQYEFPPPPAPEHFERFAAGLRAQEPRRFTQVGGGGLFQHMQNLRGPEGFFLDIAEDRQEFHELGDRLVAYYQPILRAYLEAGADCATWGDDWGTQTAMLCSPAAWRRLFRPWYQALFDIVLEYGRKLWIHTDGWSTEIIPDLVEMGISLLNPQHTIMGTRRVGELAGGRICIRTDIDRQGVIPFGTPDDVRAAVREAMECFGRFNGGIMLHGEIGPNVPFENIEALYSAFYEYGTYPLKWLET
ncbi:MAG: hypothetical protein HYU66_03185 [Armatimonadetes bacterium]|nr:hypothetical protein [Armatimonadota bacterium]